MGSTASTENEGFLAPTLLVVCILAFAFVDVGRVGRLTDVFLPPVVETRQVWGEPGDWSAAHCYPNDWKAALAVWASDRLSDGAIMAWAVLGVHALLWTGVYFVARSLFGGSPWTALLAVLLVRIIPDLFSVRLLDAAWPSRVAAIGLAFWSIGLTMRRRWVAACAAAGLIAHFSPTVAAWFAQFILVALFCFNHQWGWRRSLIGVAIYLTLAGGPLTRFFVADIAPKAPIPPDAMLGLHFFADPTLSPLSVPLWANVCLAIYLGMTLLWMRRSFRRRATPVAIVFFLMAVAGVILEIVFVSLIPVERAARFELQNQRAFWLLWFAVFYAPMLADDLRDGWGGATNWWAIFRALIFSIPAVWAALALIERLMQPPRWNRLVVGAMVALLILTAFVLPHETIPVTQVLYALAIGAVVTMAALAVAFRQQNPATWQSAQSVVAAFVGFLAVMGLFAGKATVRTFAAARETASRRPAWEEACRWAADQSPPDSKWSVPWRPRQFRRWTGRNVLVNRAEIPSEPDRRFQWFLMYVETHHWTGGLEPPRTSPGATEALVARLREYQRCFLIGAARRVKPSPDWLLVSPALVNTHQVWYAIADRAYAPRPSPSEQSTAVHLERVHAPFLFEIYEITSTPREAP